MKDVKVVPGYRGKGWVAKSTATGQIVAWETSLTLLWILLRDLGLTY